MRCHFCAVDNLQLCDVIPSDKVKRYTDSPISSIKSQSIKLQPFDLNNARANNVSQIAEAELEESLENMERRITSQAREERRENFYNTVSFTREGHAEPLVQVMYETAQGYPS